MVPIAWEEFTPVQTMHVIQTVEQQKLAVADEVILTHALVLATLFGLDAYEVALAIFIADLLIHLCR